MSRGKKLNEKRCKILNNCADKLFRILNDICYKNLSIADLISINTKMPLKFKKKVLTKILN